MWPDVDGESMASFYLMQHIDDEDDEPYPTHCRYCDLGELHWEQTSNGWRLFTQDGTIHTCKQRRKKA